MPIFFFYDQIQTKFTTFLNEYYLNSITDASFKPEIITSNECYTQLLKRIPPQTLETEGLLRLLQCFINRSRDHPEKDKLKHRALLNHFVSKSTLNATEFLEQFFHLTEPLFTLSETEFEQNQMRNNKNLSFVILIVILENYGTFLDEPKCQKLFSYLSNLISSDVGTQYTESQLYGMLSIELLLCKQRDYISEGQIMSFMNSLERFEPIVDNNIYQRDCSMIDQELSFVAGWIRENALDYHDQERELLSKLSTDGVTVRNDSEELLRVRSEYSFKSGIYYYEAILLTSGPVRIGWATDCHDIIEWDRALTFDPLNNAFWFNDEICPREQSLPKCECGSVLGALIDTLNHQFCFFLNGKLLTWPNPFQRSKYEPYYAYAVLGQNQQVVFNFGQLPFKHAPNFANSKELSQLYASQKKWSTNGCRLCLMKDLKNCKYCRGVVAKWEVPKKVVDFHGQTGGNLKLYRLVQINEYDFKKKIQTGKQVNIKKQH